MTWGRVAAVLLLAGALGQARTGITNQGDAPWTREPSQLTGTPAPGPLERAAVRDLVLDPEGNVLLAYAGERGIWKIDLAGAVALHARLPDVSDGEILSMTLDPATGDLHVRDAGADWRVTPAGEVTPLTGESPEAPAEGKLEAQPEAPDRSGPNPRLRRGGLLRMALLGLGALADPAALGASGQTHPGATGVPFDLTLASNRYTADATAGLGRLGPVCAASLLSGRTVAPCVRDYRARVQAQVDDIHGQMLELLVEPAILGPGACLPGESLQGARSRMALSQGDILAAFDALNADAAAFAEQMNRDGLALETEGQVLLAGQAVASGLGGGSSEFATVASFVAREVATSLSAADQGLQAVGKIYGKVANVVLSQKAKYQRYANNQTQAALDRCTGSLPSPQPAPPPAYWPRAGTSRSAAFDSPVPALEDAVLKLMDGCVLASLHHLQLPVCSQASLAEVQFRNGTLGDLFQGISCLASGVLQGRQSFCPKAPLADSRARSDTFAFFDQFYGEINAAAADSFGCGNSFAAARQGPGTGGQCRGPGGRQSRGRRLACGRRQGKAAPARPPGPARSPWAGWCSCFCRARRALRPPMGNSDRPWAGGTADDDIRDRI